MGKCPVEFDFFADSGLVQVEIGERLKAVIIGDFLNVDTGNIMLYNIAL